MVSQGPRASILTSVSMIIIAETEVYPYFSFSFSLSNFCNTEKLALPIGNEEDKLQGLFLIASALGECVLKG